MNFVARFPRRFLLKDEKGINYNNILETNIFKQMHGKSYVPRTLEELHRTSVSC